MLFDVRMNMWRVYACNLTFYDTKTS